MDELKPSRPVWILRLICFLCPAIVHLLHTYMCVRTVPAQPRTFTHTCSFVYGVDIVTRCVSQSARIRWLHRFNGHLFRLNVIHLTKKMTPITCPSAYLALLTAVILVASCGFVVGERGSLEGCYNENIYLHKSHVFAATADECVTACEQLYYRWDSCARCKSIAQSWVLLFDKLLLVKKTQWQQISFLIWKHEMRTKFLLFVFAWFMQPSCFPLFLPDMRLSIMTIVCAPIKCPSTKWTMTNARCRAKETASKYAVDLERKVSTKLV